MSFQAYLDNIERKTGNKPDQFLQWGVNKGCTVVSALKEEFGLGHGHAMAIVALLKGARGRER